MERTPAPQAASITELHSVLSGLSYRLTRARAHERLMAIAGLPLDRPGLALLRVLASESAPLRIGELAERLSVRHPHVTRQVADLEQQGLVERLVQTEGGRVQRITLTPDGRDVVRRVFDTEHAWLTDCLADLPDEHVRHATDVLRRIARQHELAGPGGPGGTGSGAAEGRSEP